MTKEIVLSQGKVAIVDDADYEWLSRWKWCASRVPHTCYAIRSVGRGKTQKRTYMHRAILDAPPELWVDHINADGLDNRRANLRLCTRAENNRNRRKHRDTASRFKGIVPSYGKWIAQIKVNGKRFQLGRFVDEKSAARAYNEAAIRLHGEFAILNDLG